MVDSFMTGLDPDIAARLREIGHPRRYASRSYIFYEGDAASSVFVVESGLLRIDRTTRSGRVALLELASKGDLIGELAIIDSAPRSATLSTVTPTAVLQIERQAFRALISEIRELQTAIMEQLVLRIRALSSQFLETATLDATARVAARLLRIVAIEQGLGRLPEHLSGEVDLKMLINQEELGQWAGLAREGVVKGLGTLKSLDLIETGRMRVKITDLDRLRTMFPGS